MGCDISTYVEVRKDGKWELFHDHIFPPSSEYDLGGNTNSPFNWRSYGMFGFLADTRNYSCVPVIQEPDYSIPTDASKGYIEVIQDFDGYPTTVISLSTLLDFDYDSTFEDRRCTRNGDGGSTCSVGEGEV